MCWLAQRSSPSTCPPSWLCSLPAASTPFLALPYNLQRPQFLGWSATGPDLFPISLNQGLPHRFSGRNSKKFTCLMSSCGLSPLNTNTSTQTLWGSSKHQPHSCLRTFAHAVPALPISASNDLPPHCFCKCLILQGLTFIFKADFFG